MSALPLSKILRFLLIAAGLIILLSVVWSFVDNAYCGFLTGIARGSVSEGVTVEQRGSSIYFTHLEYKTVKIGEKSIVMSSEVKDWIDAVSIQFGMILVIALVAATPGMTLRRRVLYTLTGAVVAFVLQLISTVVMARTFSTVLFVIGSDLFPVLLWAIFCLKYWIQPLARANAKSAAIPK